MSELITCPNSEKGANISLECCLLSAKIISVELVKISVTIELGCRTFVFTELPSKHCEIRESQLYNAGADNVLGLNGA